MSTLNQSFMMEMWDLTKELWPLCRSLTGSGTQQTLDILSREIPDLSVHSVRSGQKFFDWEIPLEWNIKEAWIKDSKGNIIISFSSNNLHVVGYSHPINKTISYEDLIKHIHTRPDYPEAIPYVTSYYKEYWGFCMSYEQFLSLDDSTYEVFIDSNLSPGNMNFGEVIIPGLSKKEIFFSSYICHPSMGNNELSGPVVLTSLVNWIYSLTNRFYTYRIVFVPETIGSITYICKNLHHLQQYVVAGFNISCVGDTRQYSYLPSRHGNSLSDRVLKHVLSSIEPNFISYTWLDRGSDERQYCSPRVNLPVASFMRSKYGTYKEYHTSMDNLEFISPEGLNGSLSVLKRCVFYLENNFKYLSCHFCEPHLSKYNLYPSFSDPKSVSYLKSRNLLDVLSFCDGKNDLITISELLNIEFDLILDMIRILEANNLISKISDDIDCLDL